MPGSFPGGAPASVSPPHASQHLLLPLHVVHLAVRGRRARLSDELSDMRPTSAVSAGSADRGYFGLAARGVGARAAYLVRTMRCTASAMPLRYVLRSRLSVWVSRRSPRAVVVQPTARLSIMSRICEALRPSLTLPSCWA